MYVHMYIQYIHTIQAVEELLFSSRLVAWGVSLVLSPKSKIKKERGGERERRRSIATVHISLPVSFLLHDLFQQHLVIIYLFFNIHENAWPCPLYPCGESFFLRLIGIRHILSLENRWEEKKKKDLKEFP